MDKKLQGIIPAVVTPLTKKGELDCEALKRIVERIMDWGGSGIMVLGSTGEGPLHERETAVRMIQKAVELVGARGTVVAGTTAVTFEQSMFLADAACEAGAAAVLNIPPFYFNLDDQEILRYYTRYADRCRIPVMIYHMPSVSRRMISLDTVKRLSRHGNIKGIKDSSGNYLFFQELAAAFERNPDFSVFMGKALLIYGALAAGADGTMTPAGNLFPWLEQQIYRMFQSGELEGARGLQEKISQVFRAINGNGKDLGTNIKGILSVRGIAGEQTPDYITPLEAGEARRLNDLMEEVLGEWMEPEGVRQNERTAPCGTGRVKPGEQYSVLCGKLWLSSTEAMDESTERSADRAGRA